MYHMSIVQLCLPFGRPFGELTKHHSVWKLQEKSHSTLRAKRATFTFWVDKSSIKMLNVATFWKPKVYGQTVLPDMSLLKGQKLVENARNSNTTFRVIFKQCVVEEKIFKEKVNLKSKIPQNLP